MSYVNVNGDPLNVSVADAVLLAEPYAYSEFQMVQAVDGPTPYWRIRRGRRDGTRHQYDRTLGTGATEEAAWRAVWSRTMLEEMKRGN